MSELSSHVRLSADVVVRRLEPADSMTELTALLHRAYARLADMGFRAWASHQDEQVTRERAAKGECFVGTRDGRLVATITLLYPGVPGGCPWYDQPGIAQFEQFAVAPELQGQGLGVALLDLVERRAQEIGARELALDTAENAIHLVRFYENRGYRHVGYAQWNGVNYRSRVLSKTLA